MKLGRPKSKDPTCIIKTKRLKKSDLKKIEKMFGSFGKFIEYCLNELIRGER
ncbi:MAG: hypothetical protein OEL89_00220 [Candidatus Peregrinibacteria bacterium]|nr:hypothetical protein [Candidatus Peregrinibacteria bacterium]